MASTTMRPIVDEEADRLQEEIKRLQEQVLTLPVDMLKSELSARATAILSAQPTSKLINSLDAESKAPFDPNHANGQDPSATTATDPSSTTTAPTNDADPPPSAPPRNPLRGGSVPLSSLPPNSIQRVVARLHTQETYDQHCLYRIGTSISAFGVRDPDPKAVDNGKMLGIRFDVMANGRFIRPYYVMLNRPYLPRALHLRVHRHTCPPHIPFAGLAASYLPPPPASLIAAQSPADVTAEDLEEARALSQDLYEFARSLRREILRYHNRIAMIGDIRHRVGISESARETAAERKRLRKLQKRAQRRARRKEAGQEDDDESHDDDDDDDEDDEDGAHSNTVADVMAVDPEAKQIRIDWVDGRTGRLVLDDDGNVTSLVIVTEAGRDRDTERNLWYENMRIEDIAEKLIHA